MTRRQQIISILEQNKQSVQQLANYFQTTLKEILEDLKHIEKSVKLDSAQKPMVFDMPNVQKRVDRSADVLG